MFKLLILLVTFWTIYAKANFFPDNYQRSLDEGELVIHNLAIHQVVGKAEENNYFIQSTDNFNWITNVSREELAITSGCAQEICVNDKMLDIGYMRMVTVKGITYTGEYLVDTKEGWNGFYKPFKNNMARVTGCHPDQNRKLCIGDYVRNNFGKVMIVVAFHPDWKLVLKSTDGWNSYQSYVDANSITVLDKK